MPKKIAKTGRGWCTRHFQAQQQRHQILMAAADCIQFCFPHQRKEASAGLEAAEAASDVVQAQAAEAAAVVAEVD